MNKPRLKLSAEVECWPLWLAENEESIFENVDPAELGLSNELRDELNEWAATWDSQYSRSDPHDVLAGEEIDVEAFRRQGREILAQLRKECGDEFEITYDGDQVEER